MNTIIIIIIIFFLLFYFVGAYFKSIENFSTSNVGPYNIVTCPPQFTKVESTNDIYYNSGNIGIGKIPTTHYKLDVDGYIKTKNFVVYNEGADFRINKTDNVGNIQCYFAVFNDISFGNNNMYIYVNKDLFNQASSPNLAFSTSEIPRMLIGKDGNIGIGEYITTESTYKFQVGGDVNTTGNYKVNGVDLNYSHLAGTPIKSYNSNEIVQTIFAPYKKMAVKTTGETNWVFPDNNETSGFIVKITPKYSSSGILLDLKMHFGFHHSDDARWWGARLYRKVGTGSWTQCMQAEGDFLSNDGATGNGTSCWFGDTSGVNGDPTMGTCSASYMDLPNTTSEVIYTIAVRCRLGLSDIGDEIWYINRAHDQGDSFRPVPMSSWTAHEIYNPT